MSTTKTTKSAEWTSDVLDTLQQEIAELSHRYLVELDALRRQSLGSDEYIEHWAQADVLLYWLQMKIADARQEIERLEQTWPD